MEKQTQTRVTVTDIDISFAQMVTLIIRFAFACIPAAIILGFVAVCVTFLFGGSLAVLVSALGSG